MARIGLALGGGSARGWAHIGVIEALAEAGIEPDIVCGSSIGALVGAAHVAGRLAALKEFAESVTWRQIVGALDMRMSRGGLFDGRRIVKLLRELRIAAPIEDHAKAFVAVASDLETGEEIWLRDGPIDAAVRASISLPGIFKPVRRDDRWLVDGGLVNPVPVSACRALGADFVIAVDLNGDLAGRLGRHKAGGLLRGWIDRTPRLRARATRIAPRLFAPRPRPPRIHDVIANAVYIMQDRITRGRLAVEAPDVLLSPRLSKIGFLDFNRAADAIAEGRACVARALPDLHR